MIAILSTRWIVLDIEGTLTPTEQIHTVLYDYARPRLGPWIDEHPDDPEVAEAVGQIRRLGELPDSADTAALVTVLHGWMDADEKITPLKTLQGLIWQHGYAEGELTTALFPDVAPALAQWRKAGIDLAIFSSGSVAAQIASFSRTSDGDVTEFFSRHFDTVNAGPKREAASYQSITEALGADPAEVLFLSDVPAELDAAAEAGWQTVGVARAGEPYGDADFGPHRKIGSFDGIRAGVRRRPSASSPGSSDEGAEPVSVGELRAAGRALAAEAARYAAMGWMHGTSGNLSVVLRRDPLRLAVTASGRDKGELTEDDVVVVDESGRGAADSPCPERVPSAEAGLHARIAAVSGAGAVVHVHALAPVVAAELWPDGVVLRDLEMLKGLGRAAHDDVVTVPVIRNDQDMRVLGDAFEAGFDAGTPALIVARHGLYVWGDDPRQARHRLECLEWSLRFAVETRQTVTPQVSQVSQAPQSGQTPPTDQTGQTGQTGQAPQTDRSNQTSQNDQPGQSDQTGRNDQTGRTRKPGQAGQAGKPTTRTKNRQGR
ncbi:acireductone synthase [Streptosporangium sp. NPDC051022]|uniref:acireductone synthase n=1 Tax=Streptosporangium sp. NPDC051022 TaxID=3155752 RepID=UPI0034422BAF